MVCEFYKGNNIFKMIPRPAKSNIIFLMLFKYKSAGQGRGGGEVKMEKRIKPDHQVCRQTRFYRRCRDELFQLLGRVCKKCGATEGLSFDIIIADLEPKSHHGKMSSNQRIVYYRRQHENGNVQVLCLSCNTTKSNTENYAPY